MPDQDENKRLEQYYFNDLQGDFYAGKYYRLRDREEESAIVYSDDADKRIFSFIIKDYFLAGRILEVGCAMGYLIRQLVGFGFNAVGIDFSDYCVNRVAPEIRDRVKKADLMSLPFPDKSFDLVLGLDILEHLPPSMLMTSLLSIRRVLKPGGIYFGVIPAYGENNFGPMIFDFRQKESWIEDAAMDRPFREIPLDVDGKPHMGHLIHATVDWWDRQFALAGFQRLGILERAIHRIYDVYLDRGRWGIFIFQKKRDSIIDWLFHPRQVIDRARIQGMPYRPQGFFNWESWPGIGWARWTGITATELIRRKGRFILITFLVDHPDCSSSNPVMVNFTLNVNPTVIFQVTSPGWRIARIPWEKKAKFGVLQMNVSRTFVPADSPGSEDRRELGIALQAIRQSYV